MNWKQALALAAVLGVTVTTALADPIDDGFPPPQYDIGGVTEADTLINYIDRFGDNAPPLVRVKIGEALAECDRIQMERYRVHYVYEGRLLACLIRDFDLSRPIIVYSYAPADPTFAARLLRHETGHLIGWPGDHTR